MARSMKLREVQRRLLANNCGVLRDTGRHTVWGCPCGQHSTPVPRHGEVSPGVIRNVIRDLKCLPEGWLQ